MNTVAYVADFIYTVCFGLFILFLSNTTMSKFLSVFVIATIGMIVTGVVVPSSLAGGILVAIMFLAFMTLMCIGLN